jgi:hypothetical protein
MDDSAAWMLALAAIGLCLLQAKQVGRIERDLNLVIDGDLETVKLRRKLDGYPRKTDE